MTNYEIAQEINSRIGDVPVTDSLYEAALTIYQQLGGEVSEFDDVYSILQSIKEIARPGGDPITKVNVLPKSGEEYETKFLRTPDDKIYTTGKVTMPATYTNRLPDAQQIDKGYMYEDETISYYKGVYKIVYNGGEVNGYGWLWKEGDEWMIQVTSKDAVHTNRGDSVYVLGWEDATALDEENNVAYTDMDGVEEYTVTAHVIPATYNAPEASQIGNAYLDITGDKCYYTGKAVTLIVSDGQINGLYQWLYDDDDSENAGRLTNQQASNIYCDINGVDHFYANTQQCMGVDIYNGWSKSGDTWTNMNLTLSDIQFYSLGNYSETEIGYVYIPQLNASDAEQVGKAYIDAPDYKYTYTGEQTTITVDGEELSVYVWDDAVGEDTMYSNKRASEIYNTYRDVDDVHFYCIVDGEYVESTFEGGDFYGIITVKYQRIDKPQSTLYGWQQVSVQGLILDEPVSKRYLLRGADLPDMRQEYALTIREAWVNFNDETYTFNGKTYYKWIKYDDVYEEWKDGGKDAPSMPDRYITGNAEIWMLTTTLTPKLPFTLKSPECAYVITTNGETSEGGDYVIVDRECPKMAIEYTNGIISYFD